jgi:hypothetical protein
MTTTPARKPEIASLLVNLVDEPAFFQLAHNAFINEIFEPKLRPGFSADRFLDLNLRALPRH